MASTTGNTSALPVLRQRLGRWTSRVPRPARVAAKEPIVQLMALGVALLLLHGLLHTWQRPPTRSELEALTDDRIRSEVLVREALALGLDRDDTIIRRRLRQKMEFLSEEQAAQGTPTDRDLLAHLEAHPDQFRTDPLLSFRHVFLDPEQRGDDLAAEARRLLARLNGPQPPADPSSLGDPLLLVEPLLTGMPKAEVAAILGGSFADELVQREPDRWVGPIESGYGLHLVRVQQLIPGELPPLEQIRPQVEQEWRAARSSEREESFYRRLRGKYTISRLEIPASPAQAASAPLQR